MFTDNQYRRGMAAWPRFGRKAEKEEVMPRAVPQTNNTVFSMIQKEYNTVDALIMRYGGIKQAAMVALLKAVQKAGFECEVLLDDLGGELGFTIKAETEHGVPMSHDLRMRDSGPVVSVYAFCEELSTAIDRFDMTGEAYRLLSDKQHGIIFEDVRAAKEELAAWTQRLGLLLGSVGRVLSTYRSHGLYSDLYDYKEGFTLAEMKSVSERDLNTDDSISTEDGSSYSDGPQLMEPERIVDEVEPDKYTLKSGVTLTWTDVQEAASIYMRREDRRMVQDRIRKVFANRIFGRVPQKELDLIVDRMNSYKREHPNESAIAAMDAAIESWRAEVFALVLDRFYVKYQAYFPGRILDKVDLEAGMEDASVDVFHSKKYALQYLETNDYWLWKMVVKERDQSVVRAHR